MAIVKVIRAELWGNYRDGFDNNGNYKIGEFETDKDLEETELSPKSIVKIAREWFAGCSFPLNESSSNFIGQKSKRLTVEWQSELVDYLTGNVIGAIYDVSYRGTYIGEINITYDKALTLA